MENYNFQIEHINFKWSETPVSFSKIFEGNRAAFVFARELAEENGREIRVTCCPREDVNKVSGTYISSRPRISISKE